MKGHSSSTPDEFLADLAVFNIGHVIDIRSHPRSMWPHFSREAMADPGGWLAENQIRYQWVPVLAGWSSRHADNPQLVDRMGREGVDLSIYRSGDFPRAALNAKVPGRRWSRQHELNFSWYTTTFEFQEIMDHILDQTESGNWPTTVLLCSEYDWTKCHRAQIADYANYSGHDVIHLAGAHSISHVRYFPDRLTKYDRGILENWSHHDCP